MSTEGPAGTPSQPGLLASTLVLTVVAAPEVIHRTSVRLGTVTGSEVT
ncbi:hypothetical protein [Dietzia alimentaria]|nr:hypothetical protein [Dietzia alimentaria]